MWCCLVLTRLLAWMEQHKCSIPNMVRIITTLCKSKGISNCFPILKDKQSIQNKTITSNTNRHTYWNELHFYCPHKLLSTQSTPTAAAALHLFHSPEENAQYVGKKQHQTDSCGETLCIIGPLDLLVLGDVGHGAPEHNHAGCQPWEQSPRAFHVLLWCLLHRSILTNTPSLHSHPLYDSTLDHRFSLKSAKIKSKKVCYCKLLKHSLKPQYHFP